MKTIMKSKNRLAGQGLGEYILLVIMVGVVVIAAILILGPKIGNLLTRVDNSIAEETTPQLQATLTETPTPTPEPTATPTRTRTAVILSDLEQRILDFHRLHGTWPRSWGAYAYTDIGLNQADWAVPIEGIYWGPHGSDIGLGNKKGDNIQIYVNDLNGNTLHLFDSWNIWCVPSSTTCYFHTIAPGNEVDISTLVIVQK